MDAATNKRTHVGLNVPRATKNMRNKMANAAPFGAMDKKAVTGVGDP
jgi:hypothetical protein